MFPPTISYMQNLSFRMLELEGKHEQDVKAVTQQSEKLGFLEQQVNAQCNRCGQ